MIVFAGLGGARVLAHNRMALRPYIQRDAGGEISDPSSAIHVSIPLNDTEFLTLFWRKRSVGMLYHLTPELRTATPPRSEPTMRFLIAGLHMFWEPTVIPNAVRSHLYAVRFEYRRPTPPYAMVSQKPPFHPPASIGDNQTPWLMMDIVLCPPVSAPVPSYFVPSILRERAALKRVRDVNTAKTGNRPVCSGSFRAIPHNENEFGECSFDGSEPAWAALPERSLYVAD